MQFQIGAVQVTAASFSSKLIDATTSGLKYGLIIALAALGLSLIFGTTGLTNFAHGELITFGGIVTYFLNRDLGLPVIAAGVLAVVPSALFGYAQDRGLWRPLRNRGTGLIAMMIVSIGFALLLRSIYQYTFGGSTKTLSQYVAQGRNDYGPIALSDKEVAIFAISIITLVVTCIALMRTRLGKAMRAVSDNPALSASSGMRVDGVISSVWILGTALTGLSGVLLAINQQVNFQMGFKVLLLDLCCGHPRWPWHDLGCAARLTRDRSDGRGRAGPLDLGLAPGSGLHQGRRRAARDDPHPARQTAGHPRPSSADRIRGEPWTSEQSSTPPSRRLSDPRPSSSHWRPSDSTSISATPDCSISVKPDSWRSRPSAWRSAS